MSGLRGTGAAWLLANFHLLFGITAHRARKPLSTEIGKSILYFFNDTLTLNEVGNNTGEGMTERNIKLERL